MVDHITIKKAINGYIVNSGWLATGEDNTILFKDMGEVVDHLDECFKKPFKDLTYVTKIKDTKTKE